MGIKQFDKLQKTRLFTAPYNVYSLMLNEFKAALQKGVSQEPATTCKHGPQPAKAPAKDTKKKKQQRRKRNAQHTASTTYVPIRNYCTTLKYVDMNTENGAGDEETNKNKQWQTPKDTEMTPALRVTANCSLIKIQNDIKTQLNDEFVLELVNYFS
jgi:hypothetical protein